MINFNFLQKCYSCGACKNVCPRNAIKMTGNCLPTVNNNCINCGLCEKVCPYLNETNYGIVIKGNGFVCRNKNIETRKVSSSGGVFSLLALDAIQNGWYVCGCVYDVNFMPCHIVSNKHEEIFSMLGSKYVKSDLGNVLEDIRKLLKAGAKILFSGTPCQIAGVRNCFPETENILYVSVVCHGSIERDIWKAYLKEESKRGKITSVTMRDKSKGWLNYGLKFTFQDGTEHITYRKNDGYFLKAFTDGLLERDRCLGCAYKGDRILADILLGDAWGMEKFFPELLDEWGLSEVICLTEKGLRAFNRISVATDFSEVNVDTLVENNQRIVSPARVNLRYKSFRKKFEAEPDKIQMFCEKYAKPTILNRIAAKARTIKIG